MHDLFAGVVVGISASERPYIGGSTDGTAWSLITGYNGLSRIFGGERGDPGGDSSLGSEVTAWVRKHGTAVKNSDFTSDSSSQSSRSAMYRLDPSDVS